MIPFFVGDKNGLVSKCTKCFLQEVKERRSEIRVHPTTRKWRCHFPSYKTIARAHCSYFRKSLKKSFELKFKG